MNMKRNKGYIFFLAALIFIMALGVSSTVAADSEDTSLIENGILYAQKAGDPAPAEDFEKLNIALKQLDTILLIDSFSSAEDKTAAQKTYDDSLAVYNNKASTTEQINAAISAVVAQTYLRTDKYRMVGMSSGKNFLPIISEHEDHGQVVLSANTSANNLRGWHFERLANGQYIIKHVESGLYLSLDPLEEEKDTDCLLLVEPQDDTDIQKWEVKFDNRGLCMLSSVYSKKYLDVYEGQISEGAQLIQHPFTDAATQKFVLYKSRADLVATPQDYEQLNMALVQLKVFIDIDSFVSESDKTAVEKIYADGMTILNSTGATLGQVYIAKEAADDQAYLRSGRYSIKGRQSDKYVLPSLNGTTYDHGKVKLATSATSSDEWFFERHPDGTYVIEHIKSWYALTPDITKLEEKSCDLLVVPLDGSSVQEWILIFAGDNSFYFHNVLTGKYMDVTNGGTEEGTQIIQYPLNEGVNQKFIVLKSQKGAPASEEEFEGLNKALMKLKVFMDLGILTIEDDRSMQKLYAGGMAVYDDKTSTDIVVAKTIENVAAYTYLRSGRYRIIAKRAQKMFLPRFIGGTYYDKIVRLVGEATIAEEWYIERLFDGNYLLKHMESSYCIAPDKTKLDKESCELVVTFFKGGDLQKWTLSFDTDNSFLFRNVETGKYMDVYGGFTEDETNLVQYPFNGGSSQQFIIEKSKADTPPSPHELEQLDNVIKQLKIYLDFDVFASKDERLTAHKAYDDGISVYSHKGSNDAQVSYATGAVKDQSYLRDGRYYITGKQSGKYILPRSAEKESKIILKDITQASKSQDWYFERQINETYVINHMMEDIKGHYLSLLPTDPYQQDLVATSNAASGVQQWDLSIENGAFRFRNMYTRRYMDVFNNLIEEGTRVIQFEYQSAENQRFVLQRSDL